MLQDAQQPVAINYCWASEGKGKGCLKIANAA